MFKILFLFAFLFTLADTQKKSTNPEDVVILIYKGKKYKFIDIFPIISQRLGNRRIESLDPKEIEQIVKSSIKIFITNLEIYEKYKNNKFEKNKKFQKKWLETVKAYVISCAFDNESDAIPENKLKAYYEKNIKQFISSSYSLSMIVLKDEAKANSIYKALLSNPGNFETIAASENYTEELKKAKGTFQVQKNEMTTLFGAKNAEQIEKMPVNKIAKLELGNGFFFIVKLNKKTIIQKSLEEVKETIKRFVMFEEIDSEAEKIILQNEKNNQLTIFPEEAKEKQLKFKDLN